MNISLELYKTFYYVAKNESISRAANELLISQPAISKSIKALEEQLNITLFVRKREGVLLTEPGEIIYKKIKSAMELINSAEGDIASLTNMEYGSINIGTSKTILKEHLMPFIKKFHITYPKIKIRIFTDKTSELIKKAKMGLIDVIFTNLPFKLPSEFESCKLLDLHDCLVANENFSSLKNKKISKKELEKLPLLLLTKGATTRIQFDDYCTENNITTNPEMELGSNTLIKEFTLAGFGIGLLSEEHVKQELKTKQLFKLDIEIPLKEKYLGMIYNHDMNSLTAKNFVKYIKNNISLF